MSNPKSRPENFPGFSLSKKSPTKKPRTFAGTTPPTQNNVIAYILTVSQQFSVFLFFEVLALELLVTMPLRLRLIMFSCDIFLFVYMCQCTIYSWIVLRFVNFFQYFFWRRY